MNDGKIDFNWLGLAFVDDDIPDYQELEKAIAKKSEELRDAAMDAMDDWLLERGLESVMGVVRKADKPVPSRNTMDTPPTGIRVPSPHGTLVAHSFGDEEYPGILIELERGKEPGDNVSLALVEYIPGGESLSGFYPTDPLRMAKEAQEVPDSRKTHNQYGRECVSAGFVTRAWPHELLDEELHIRTFHDAYLERDLTYTTCDKFGNIETCTKLHPPIIESWVASAGGIVGTGRTRDEAVAMFVRQVEAQTVYQGLTMIAKDLGYSVYAKDVDGTLYPISGGHSQGLFIYR